MKSYTNMFKTIVQTGTQYFRGGAEQAKQPIIKIDKANTIMEAKCFNDSKIDPKKCIEILSKLLFLMSQGEPFTTQQTNKIFFSMTKLFQTDDLNLRRLLYLLVKQSKNQESIFIVTGTLVKDLQSKLASVKRNSLRTVPLVLDPSSFTQIQRYIRTDISDPNPSIASAALLSSNQIYKTHQEMVRKWSPEVSEKLKSNDPEVQYFSLALLGEIKKKDSNFLRKSLFSLMKSAPTGVAVIQHLRMLNTLLQRADYQSNEAVEFKNYVLKQVRSNDDSIVIEAAKIACESHLFSNTDLRDVVKILQTYLASESIVKKYSVLKMYNSLLKNSSRRSLILNVKEIEKVLKDKNLSLSSTAASILLRICSQGYLEKLFSQIDNTMKEMSNDYKVDVVKSLVNVLKTYPKQYVLVNNFLLSIMQKQDSDDVKKEIIEVMKYEVSELGGSAKTQCIQELAKFLGYAKNQKLHFQILGIISRQAQKEDITSELLKNIIHQVYLQQGSIRACGLSTLIKISKINKEKGKMLEKTIEKFRSDSDQEVRERILFQETSKSISSYELDVIEGYLYNNCQQIQASTNQEMLNFENMKKWGEEVGSKILKKKKHNSKVDKQKQSEQEEQRYRELFGNHSTFKNYGVLRKVNKSIRITDPEAEGLQVEVRIFLFDNHLIAEYLLENKFEDTELQNVYIDIKHSGESFTTQHIIPAKVIGKQGKGECYVGLARCEQCTDLLPEQTMSSVVKYTAKEYTGDKVKATYEDQISLQNFELELSTYMSHWYLDGDEFDKEWETFKAETKESGFQLNFANKQAAVEELKKLFGMRVVSVQESGIKIRMKLSGKYLGVYRTMFILTIAFDTKTGCLLNMQAKSEIEKLIKELTGPMCDDDDDDQQ